MAVLAAVNRIPVAFDVSVRVLPPLRLLWRLFVKKDECTNAVDYETRLAIAEAISLTHHPLLKYNDNTCARCWSAAEAVMVALDLWGAPVEDPGPSGGREYLDTDGE